MCRLCYCSLPNFGRSRQEQLCRTDARQPSIRPDMTSRPIRSCADCRLFLSGSARIGKTAITLSGAALEAQWDRVGYITSSDRCRRPVGREKKKKPPCLIFGTRTISSSISMARTTKGLLRLKSGVTSDFWRLIGHVVQRGVNMAIASHC